VNNSTARRALIGATWLTAGGYISFALNFGANILLARLLFPQDFGLFALIASVVEILLLPAGLSFSQGIIQMAGEPEIEDTAYRMTLRLGAVLGLIGVVSAVVMWSWRGPAVGILLLAVFGVRLITTLSYVYSAQLEREFRYRGLSALRAVGAAASVAAASLLAWSGAGVWSLVAREGVAILVTYAGVRRLTGWRYAGRTNPQTAQRLVRFAVRMLATRIFEVANYRADILLVGAIAGTVALGFYDRARLLAELGYYAVSFAAVQVAFPLYARFQDDPARVAASFGLIHYFLIRAMAPVMLVMVVLPRELLAFLFGPRWEPAAGAMRWLAGYALCLPILDNVKVLLTGVGRLNDVVRIKIVQVLTILPALILFVPRWGIDGAAAAATLSAAVGLAAAYGALRRYLPAFSLHTYLRPALAAAAAAGLVVVGRTGVPDVVLLALLPLAYLAVLAALERGQLLHNARRLWPMGRFSEGPAV